MSAANAVKAVFEDVNGAIICEETADSSVIVPEEAAAENTEEVLGVGGLKRSLGPREHPQELEDSGEV